MTEIELSKYRICSRIGAQRSVVLEHAAVAFVRYEEIAGCVHIDTRWKA